MIASTKFDLSITYRFFRYVSYYSSSFLENKKDNIGANS